MVVTSGGGGGGGRGWTVYEMAGFLFHVQWTSSCDHAATCSAVLYRISYDVGWCLSFSSSTECFFLFVNIDRYPQLLSFPAWVRGCCSTWTRSSMCLGTRLLYEACERISHIFYVLLALFAWHRDLLREKWTRISLQFTLGNLELFPRAVPGSHRVRQSTLLLEEFHIFHREGGLGLPCAVRT